MINIFLLLVWYFSILVTHNSCYVIYNLRSFYFAGAKKTKKSRSSSISLSPDPKGSKEKSPLKLRRRYRMRHRSRSQNRYQIKLHSRSRSPVYTKKIGGVPRTKAAGIPPTSGNFSHYT